MAMVGTKLPLIGYSLDIEALSSNPEEREMYLQDELVFHGSMRVGWGAGIIETIRGLRGNAASMTVPTLIVQGEKDTMTPLSGAESYYALLPPTKRKMIVYPELRHEILREAKKEAVMDDIIQWFSENTK